VSSNLTLSANQEKLTMEAALLIQAASNIAGAMAATQYGKFGGMEASRLTEVATIAVRIARAIEAEVLRQPWARCTVEVNQCIGINELQR
jgi:hypothetical protein